MATADDIYYLEHHRRHLVGHLAEMRCTLDELAPHCVAMRIATEAQVKDKTQMLREVEARLTEARARRAAALNVTDPGCSD